MGKHELNPIQSYHFQAELSVWAGTFFLSTSLFNDMIHQLPRIRGGINKKKTVFFLRKNSEILRPPRPLPAVWRPQFFLIRKFWNWRKIPKYSQFFMIKSLWIGWDTPFGENIQKSPVFMITPFWNRWDGPPVWRKKSKQIPFFSDKEISDLARPPPPPFRSFSEKKNSFFYASP